MFVGSSALNIKFILTVWHLFIFVASVLSIWVILATAREKPLVESFNNSFETPNLYTLEHCLKRLVMLSF